jgi:two-component system chemotaxis sensor kinase CheA
MTTEQLRLVPASTVFASLERTARDAAQALGKTVLFEAKGGSTRLDSHVLGTLQPALVQAVRNAVAHGIETEAVRTDCGKPRVGRIVLEVFRRAGRVVFRCSDDGRGIDIEAVRRALQKRGLSPAEVQRLGLDDLVQMLMKGGVSTAQTISEVSGRGIGLDLVREIAERLRADVKIDTRPKEGTTLEIVVPVQIASLEALVVEANGGLAAIPLESIASTQRVVQEEILSTPAGDTILYEGKAVPFIPLAALLQIGKENSKPAKAWSVIVLHDGAKYAAVGVDRLLSNINIVQRPLPPLAPVTPLVPGLWLDAEGNPQMVVEPSEITATAHGWVRAARTTEKPGLLPILVIDDSLTTRMLEQSILESAGYEVDTAVCAEEGMEKARQRRYGLFLVDVEMPGMDGFTFVEKTRADTVLREVPAILVTSRNSKDDLERGRAVGAYAHVIKSDFDQGNLLYMIESLVGRP